MKYERGWANLRSRQAEPLKRSRSTSSVIPGTRPKQFPAGTYDLQCALIVGRRTESTDRKTSLNEALRVFGVQA